MNKIKQGHLGVNNNRWWHVCEKAYEQRWIEASFDTRIRCMASRSFVATCNFYLYSISKLWCDKFWIHFNISKLWWDKIWIHFI